jgi:hypothetical protein
MDTLIPDLDRICPACDCPSLTCISTTADKWLGHCPACDWQGWQDLPAYVPPGPSAPAQHAHKTHIRFARNPERTPILHRTTPPPANKNLPPSELLPDHPAPNPSLLVGGRALRGYGAHGASSRALRPWPKWCHMVAPFALFALALAVLLYAGFTDGFTWPRGTDPYVQVSPPTYQYTRACGWNTAGAWDCVDGARDESGRYCGTNDNGRKECVVLPAGE